METRGQILINRVMPRENARLRQPLILGGRRMQKGDYLFDDEAAHAMADEDDWVLSKDKY